MEAPAVLGVQICTQWWHMRAQGPLKGARDLPSGGEEQEPSCLSSMATVFVVFFFFAIMIIMTALEIWNNFLKSPIFQLRNLSLGEVNRIAQGC